MFLSSGVESCSENVADSKFVYLKFIGNLPCWSKLYPASSVPLRDQKKKSPIIHNVAFSYRWRGYSSYRLCLRKNTISRYWFYIFDANGDRVSFQHGTVDCSGLVDIFRMLLSIAVKIYYNKSIIITDLIILILDRTNSST